MTEAQTLDFLMKGGWFALEQAGRLINDARLLLEARSYSSAVGLALLSREEVAKSRELFAFWIRVSRGETITRQSAVVHIKQMTHVKKQRRGVSTFTLPVDSAALELLLAGRAAAPEQYDKLAERLRLMSERLMKRGPSERADKREEAFYVDASPQRDGWRRPADITPGEAKEIIDDARRDYWQQYRGTGMPAWASDLDRLHAALAQWQDKPPLPSVES